MRAEGGGKYVVWILIALLTFPLYLVIPQTWLHFQIHLDLKNASYGYTLDLFMKYVKEYMFLTYLFFA